MNKHGMSRELRQKLTFEHYSASREIAQVERAMWHEIRRVTVWFSDTIDCWVLIDAAQQWHALPVSETSQLGELIAQENLCPGTIAKKLSGDSAEDTTKLLLERVRHITRGLRQQRAYEKKPQTQPLAEVYDDLLAGLI